MLCSVSCRLHSTDIDFSSLLLQSSRRARLITLDKPAAPSSSLATLFIGRRHSASVSQLVNGLFTARVPYRRQAPSVGTPRPTEIGQND